MRKFGILSATIFISMLLAGIYGIIHDQVTYSISPEYFTKFKYHQFGFDPIWFNGHRQTVTVIGFLATWWVGLVIGIVLGFSSLVFSSYVQMRNVIKKGLIIIFITTIFSAILGFFIGKLYLSNKGVGLWIPEDVINKSDFITVGSIHNFSYIGGLAGLIFAIIHIIRKNVLINRTLTKELLK